MPSTQTYTWCHSKKMYTIIVFYKTYKNPNINDVTLLLLIQHPNSYSYFNTGAEMFNCNPPEHCTAVSCPFVPHNE